MLETDDKSLSLYDLRSTCGTYLDGQRIASVVLPLTAHDTVPGQDGTFDDGSLLTIGGTTFRINLVDCPPPGTATETAAALWPCGRTMRDACPLQCH
jgi:hypothetical protein